MRRPPAVRIRHGSVAVAVVVCVFHSTFTPAPAGAVCNHSVTINDAPVGEWFNLLGSPSGLAGQGPITIVATPAEGIAELWIASAYECCRTNSVNLFPNEPAVLDCNDQSYDGGLAEAVYLEIFNGSPFKPTFGGYSGILGIVIEREEGCSQGPLEGLAHFVARSTDIEGDGDTDEDDENLLRAARGTGQLQFDLDFDGDVDSCDVEIILAEANRRVVRGYGSSSWASAVCYSTP